MNKYIGCKMVEAEPMTDIDFNVFKKGAITEDFGGITTEGYKVVYPDGYVSWSPKEVFEKAYLRVGDNNTIMESNVNDFVKSLDVSQWGDKTTVVHATLANGFIMTESSSCVDPTNFNMDIGENICKEKIYNKLWGMLGFLLQTAKEGIK